ncbi:MAG: acyl-ACP--UDP-N-acetylglucosamine O-acyltransferase [Lentilitoribacter sp.]
MIAATAEIHPTAIVEDGATIGEGCKIGPFSIIGPKVKLGSNITIRSHVVIDGNTSIGSGCSIFSHAILGTEPQNVHYKGEDTELIIGKNCQIRESVTMNTGMPDAGNKTVVGDNCLFLVNSHVGHDCRLGDNIILSNNVMLGGHVEVGNNVIMGGGAGVHQFVRVGHHAFIGGLCIAKNDVIPFGMADGVPGELLGLNVIGLRRAGYAKQQILDIRRFVKRVFEGEGTFKQRLAEIDPSQLGEAEKDIFDYINTDSKRGLITARLSHKSQD